MREFFLKLENKKRINMNKIKKQIISSCIRCESFLILQNIYIFERIEIFKKQTNLS